MMHNGMGHGSGGMGHGMGHGPGGFGRGPMGHGPGGFGRGPMYGRPPMGPPHRRHYFPLFPFFFAPRPRYYGYRTGGCLGPLLFLFLLSLLFRF